MKKILQYLFEYKTLCRQSAKEVLLNISKGMYSESEIASFITVFLMRSITIDELQGFRDALLDLCVRVDLNGNMSIDILVRCVHSKNNVNQSLIAKCTLAGTDLTVATDGYCDFSSSNGS